MDRKHIYVTNEGMKELKQELTDLKKVKRPEVLDRVSQARAMGDLSENSEYTAAREELSLIDGRIEELEDMLKRAQIIEEAEGGQIVKLGSRVNVLVGNKKEVFTLVGEWEADPHDRKISHESPLGKALIGKAVGEKVEVEAPAGKILYHIQNIE
ncbi:MAG TPA: transcription elongation factor GreA [Candidatus Levybacteria bacterium]|nr:transcription elongation factor GreA [Candidatus Levybacteria bacterium]